MSLRSSTGSTAICFSMCLNSVNLVKPFVFLFISDSIRSLGSGNGLGLISESNGFEIVRIYTIKNYQVLNLKNVPQTGILV